MFFLSIAVLVTATFAHAESSNLVEIDQVTETLYVESTTDTDKDGEKDRIFVTVKRPLSEKKLSSLFHISPYALGGTEVPMHNVDMDLLPQDAASLLKSFKSVFSRSAKDWKSTQGSLALNVNAPAYAQVSAHSVGTGHSTGCPTVGDMSEALGAKAVIDWLNGRAKAFSREGEEVKADWANGNVGMTGTSYDGTLPIMVATTGVEGLKAIVPVAAISSWYDYYRANGLVVNPGGYIGEDADILGYYIVRKGACQKEMREITRSMGREHGDYTSFWQKRDYLSKVKNIKAATFIIHGQSDWNVKQKHAIKLWNALDGVAPRRMFLHRGGHSSTSSHGVPRKVQDWFDHFLEGVENGITEGAQVEVELSDRTLITQEEWPNENTLSERLYLDASGSLSLTSGQASELTIIDSGSTDRLESLLQNPSVKKSERLVFLTSALEEDTLLSGTTKVNLTLAVLNREAANLTVALIEYDRLGNGKIITRGWADPQNYRDLSHGERLIPGQSYELSFELEPKQYRLAKGSRLGVLVASTDYEYTLRPSSGTELKLKLGRESFVEVMMGKL